MYFASNIFEMPIRDINVNQIGWYYTLCDFGLLLLSFFKNDLNYFSILNFYENDNQFQNSPSCNELRSTCDHQ